MGEDFVNVGYDYQLTLNHIIEHAAKLHPKGEIVYRDIKRENYKEVYERSKRLSDALEGLGVTQGTRVVQFEWNTHRHLEIYFGVPSMGAIMHFGNPLLTPAQIAYIINHAEDEVLLVNKDFLPLIEGIKDKLKTVKHYVILTDDGMPDTKLEPVFEYEELLRSASSNYKYPELNENTVATLGYTTGTTGDPKGCWFTHRAISVHNMVWGAYCFGHRVIQAPYGALLPIVPMFHIHAWCMPYLATFFGIKLMLGGRPDPNVILEMIKEERKRVPDRH